MPSVQSTSNRRHQEGQEQQIKPVMLMSAISIAQYLPPEAMDFDLLVIDEASQVRPEDALGHEVPRAAAVLFGFQRTSGEFSAVVAQSVERLLRNGVLNDDGNGLRIGTDHRETGK